MHIETDIAIVGTGFAGIGMAIRLQQAGIRDFVLLEKGSTVGGTWRDNVYPGAACDVQSHLYSFSFAPNPDWSRKFAPQEEILDYLERVTDEHDIRPRIRFDAAVREARYDARRGLWHIETTRDTIVARVMVLGSGAFNKPALPSIRGIEGFQGDLFHTAQWDKRADLAGKRVAVIGTGASAVQVVPELARSAGKLSLFQRTPPWIMPKHNPAYTDAQKARFRDSKLARLAERGTIYARNELFALGFIGDSRIMKIGEKIALRYLHKVIRDPALRAKLTPQYRMGCKRVLLSSDYLPALTRENVEVVTDGIQEVRANAIVTRDGRTHEVDALVLATGFQVAENVAPFPIFGRDGRSLDAHWAQGAEAFKGSVVKGFPNAFFIVGPNTGLGHSSMVLMIEAQIGYALAGIELLRGEQLRAMEVLPEVQDAYNTWLQQRMSRTVWQRGGCVSYYQTSSGKNTTLWPGFTFEFMARLRKLDRADFKLEQRIEAVRTPGSDTPTARLAPDAAE
ncbi:MAG: NAD(P)/FAD-dependent oxidoreductase [Polyangiales bacterium]